MSSQKKFCWRITKIITLISFKGNEYSITERQFLGKRRMHLKKKIKTKIERYYN